MSMYRILFVALLLCIPVVTQAVTVGYMLDYSNALDDSLELHSPGPWGSIIFDDGGSAGTVAMTMTLASDLAPAGAWLDGLYLNFVIDFDLRRSVIDYQNNSTAPAASTISIGTDAYAADGFGSFDVFFDFVIGQFTAGESLIYHFTSPDPITAGSFSVFSVSPTESGGPFPVAAHLGGTGDGTSNVYIAASAVPVPAAIGLFGSGLLGLFGLSRYRAPVGL